MEISRRDWSVVESRIEKTFKKTRAQGRLALMPYLTGGYPTPADCLEILKLLADLECDLIELGVPFSDPLADGPTIQRSTQVVLSQGVNLDHIFELVGDLKAYVDVPVCLMPYYNIPYRYGLDKFARKAAESGVDGVIIPDLSIEDSQSWCKVAWKEGLDTVFLAAPTSSLERLKRISQLSRGFIYCVSLLGVTGARRELPPELKKFILTIREVTDKYLAVGFGISRGQQVEALRGLADGVIIGSALIDLIEENKDPTERSRKLKAFIREIREASG